MDVNEKLDGGEKIKEKTTDVNEDEIYNDEDSKAESKMKMKKSNKKKILISSIIGIIIILLIITLSTVFALLNMNNTKIIDGITINGIDVSGLNKEEAKEKIDEIINQKMEKDIFFKYEEFETSISPKQIDANFDVDSSIIEAYSIGRDGNIISNNFAIIKTRFNKQNICLKLNYNEDELLKQIDNINSNIPGKLTESSYYIEENKLVITKGKEGLSVNKDELKNQIIGKLNCLTETVEYINIVAQTQKPSEINLDEIYSEIYKEPKDAYYTTNPFTLYPHVDGVDFKITMEEAKSLLNEDKDEYVIPLKITKPNVTTDQIGTEAFPDLLSSFTTKYDASNKPRSTNLALAAGKINGTVLMPGENFSYNKVVGERTIAAGYKEAKVYENGRVVDGLGGGICQISSTLYNSVIYANLDIVSRRNHQFLTSYVGAGRDATVVYGSTDFVFKNTRNYPIKIKASVKNGIAKVDIYGIKEEKEYKVEIKSSVVESIPYTTSYIEDSNVESGKEIVKQKGANGCKSQTYKIVTLNGKVVSQTLLSKDTYNAMQRIVVKGTKNNNPNNTVIDTTTEPDVIDTTLPQPEDNNDIQNQEQTQNNETANAEEKPTENTNQTEL